MAMLFAIGIAPANTTAQVSGSPNIVRIVVDDQNWIGTSVQMDPDIPRSRSDYIQTPNLEALANAGMRFSRAYVSPLCRPTQMAMHTGKSWAQQQITSNGNPGNLSNFDRTLSQPWLRANDRSNPSAAQFVKEANPAYRTAHFGKYGCECALGEWGFDVLSNSRTLPAEVDPKMMFSFATQANQFIQESVDAGRPFYVEFHHNAVKGGPWEALPATIEKYQNLPRGQIHREPVFAAMTDNLDSSVGMVLDKIHDLGVDDETYVIYTSDNGGRSLASPWSGNPKGVPLFHGKGTIWEGGIRVPLIIKGPGIEPGAVSDIPVIAMDLFPTIAEFAGLPYPMHDGIEGASLMPILQNGGSLPEGMSVLRRQYAENGELFLHFTINYHMASAVIDDNFKLVKIYTGSPDSYNLHLFDLDQHTQESHIVSHALNLAQAMPEKTAELHAKLENWLVAVDASLPYDARAPIALTWSADRLGKQEDVGLDILRASLGTNRARSDLNTDGIVDERDLEIALARQPRSWRSAENVDYKDRELWLAATEEQNKPTYVETAPHQPYLPRHAFRFDGDDHMAQIHFNHVSGEAVTFDFWVRLADMDRSHLLLETGGNDVGMSLTIGEADADGRFDDLRLRLYRWGDSVNLTSSLPASVDPIRDFFNVVAVINDAHDDRHVELFVNGVSIGRVEDVAALQGSFDWGGTDAAGLGGVAGNLGSGAGSSDEQPFGTGLSGDLAFFRFFNHAIDDEQIKGYYNARLAPVDDGIVATSGMFEPAPERPTDVSRRAVEHDDRVLVMLERHDRLDQDLMVDILPEPGTTYTGAASGTLQAGSAFSSYLIHFDAVGDATAATPLIGSVTFEKPVIGVLLDADILADTDRMMGAIGRYAVGQRGFSLSASAFIQFSQDRHTMILNGPAVDLAQFRVITNLVPEPGSGPLLLAGWWISHRRRRVVAGCR